MVKLTKVKEYTTEFEESMKCKKVSTKQLKNDYYDFDPIFIEYDENLYIKGASIMRTFGTSFSSKYIGEIIPKECCIQLQVGKSRKAFYLNSKGFSYLIGSTLGYFQHAEMHKETIIKYLKNMDEDAFLKNIKIIKQTGLDTLDSVSEKYQERFKSFIESI